jgi:hypothetical protein
LPPKDERPFKFYDGTPRELLIINGDNGAKIAPEREYPQLNLLTGSWSHTA